MIALIAATAIQSAKVVEWFELNSDFTTIQAVVALPELDKRDRDLLTMICGSLGKETVTFSGAQIADLAARVGSRVRVTQMPDHLRVSFDVVNADLSTGLSMMGAILRESKIELEPILAAGQDMQFRQLPYWRQALEGQAFTMPKYALRDVQELVARVFRPENVTIGVGGKIQPGIATSKWTDFLQSWQLPRLPAMKPPTVAKISDNPLPGKANVLELTGPTISGSDAAFSTKLLALTAIGTGKGASLWRAAREKLGLSYRQEAILYPSGNGFQVRFLIAHQGNEELGEKLKKIRAGLLEDIEAWTETDRLRAIGMAESYLVRGGDLSPLYFCPGRPITRGLPDQVFMRAYWPMKTGNGWNPHLLVGRMGFVELKELKETALDFVKNATARIHKAG